MQHFKHQTTGQVYGADEQTRPPAAFYEERPTEFAKVSAPKAPKAGRKPAPAKGGDDVQTESGGQEDGTTAGDAQGDGGEKGGDA